MLELVAENYLDENAPDIAEMREVWIGCKGHGTIRLRQEERTSLMKISRVPITDIFSEISRGHYHATAKNLDAGRSRLYRAVLTTMAFKDITISQMIIRTFDV